MPLTEQEKKQIEQALRFINLARFYGMAEPRQDHN
jgi:hypothetical protein